MSKDDQYYHHKLNRFASEYQQSYKYMTILKNHYFIIFFADIFLFSYLYNFDWPQSLSPALQEPPYNLTLDQINLFYTFLSAGVIIFCFKLGMIYDKVPLRITLIVVPLILTAMQLLTGLLFYINQRWCYYVACISRIIFGVAGESLLMLQAKVLLKIYEEKSGPYIGFAIAIGLLGSPLNSFLNPILYKYFNNVYVPLLIGGVFCALNIFVGIVLSCIIVQHEKQLQQNQPLTSAQTTQTQVKQPTILEQITHFKIDFWFLQLLIVLLNAAAGGFISVGVDFIYKRYNFTYLTSGTLMIIPYLATFAFAFFWNLFHKSMRNQYLIISFISLASFIALFLLPNTENPQKSDLVWTIIILVLIGFSYSGFTMKVVPSVASIITSENAGVAYATVSTSINIGFLIMPFVSSLIAESPKVTLSMGYRNSVYLYIALSVLGLILSIVMRINNSFLTLQGNGGNNVQKQNESIS